MRGPARGTVPIPWSIVTSVAPETLQSNVELSPAVMFSGSAVKELITGNGGADTVISLARTEEGQIAVGSECKDSDERLNFSVDVSPKGSGVEKFRYVSEVSERKGSKEKGKANLEKSFEALGDAGLTCKQIQAKTGFSKSTVINHLSVLRSQNRVEMIGPQNRPLYRKKSSTSERAKAPFRPISLK